MNIVRQLGATALFIAALAVWFGMEPPTPSDPDHSDQIAAINAVDDSNNARTDGAPQQAVVNGWTTIELLQLISEQTDEASATEARDDRPAAMLGLCVAGLALLAVTSSSSLGSRTSAPQDAPSPSQSAASPSSASADPTAI